MELDIDSSARANLAAHFTRICTLKEVAFMIGENFEFLGETTATSDSIAEGEMLYIRYGSEDGSTGLTGNGVSDLQKLLANMRA